MLSSNTNIQVDSWRRVIPTCINCNQQHTVSQGHPCSNGTTSLLHRTDESTYYDFAPDPPHNPVGTGLERQITGWWGIEQPTSPLSRSVSTASSAPDMNQAWLVTVITQINGFSNTTRRIIRSLHGVSAYLSGEWEVWKFHAGSNSTLWTSDKCNEYFSIPNLFVNTCSLLSQPIDIFTMPTSMGSDMLESVVVSICFEHIHD